MLDTEMPPTIFCEFLKRLDDTATTFVITTSLAVTPLIESATAAENAAYALALLRTLATVTLFSN